MRTCVARGRTSPPTAPSCAASLASDHETPRHARDQIIGQLEFMETVVGWYESIKALPRGTLLKMMRLGQRIAKVIGD